MTSESSSKTLPQVILLLLALGGWLAFAGAFFGLVAARERIARLDAQTEEITRTADGIFKDKDSVIHMLQEQTAKLRQRVSELESAAPRERRQP